MNLRRAQLRKNEKRKPKKRKRKPKEIKNDNWTEKSKKGKGYETKQNEKKGKDAIDWSTLPTVVRQHKTKKEIKTGQQIRFGK